MRAAVDCDLDHTRRFPQGPTADHKLGPPCGHHHKLKHEATPGWALAQPVSGTFTWTSPTGRHYERRPPDRPGSPDWAPGPRRRPSTGSATAPDDETAVSTGSGDERAPGSAEAGCSGGRRA